MIAKILPQVKSNIIHVTLCLRCFPIRPAFNTPCPQLVMYLTCIYIHVVRQNSLMIFFFGPIITSLISRTGAWRWLNAQRMTDELWMGVKQQTHDRLGLMREPQIVPDALTFLQLYEHAHDFQMSNLWTPRKPLISAVVACGWTKGERCWDFQSQKLQLRKMFEICPSVHCHSLSEKLQ